MTTTKLTRVKWTSTTTLINLFGLLRFERRVICTQKKQKWNIENDLTGTLVWWREHIFEFVELRHFRILLIILKISRNLSHVFRIKWNAHIQNSTGIFWEWWRKLHSLYVIEMLWRTQFKFRRSFRFHVCCSSSSSSFSSSCCCFSPGYLSFCCFRCSFSWAIFNFDINCVELYSQLPIISIQFNRIGIENTVDMNRPLLSKYCWRENEVQCRAANSLIYSEK